MRQFLLIFVLLFLTNCGTIVGGSKYYAHVVVNDRPKAKIIYQGSVMGIRNASFLAKRRDANKFSVTIREVDCPDQTYNFTTRSFRGWSLVGSVLGWTGTAGGVLLPWGVGLDLLTGALWKPNVKEKGIVKSNYKNYLYSISYSDCQKSEANFETIPLLDIVYLKDGRVITGVIVEQIPMLSIKIQIGDGRILTFKVSEIEKMVRQ